MSKISELSDGGSLVSTDYLIAVRSGGNVKVRMDEINVDQVDLGDNEFIRLGNSQDLTLVHNASNSIINQAGIGDLLIQKAGTTKASFTTNGLEFPDNSKAIFGAGSDLQIFSNGTSSYIIEGGSGNLEIRATDIFLKSADNTKALATFDADGAASISHNGSTKLATTATGVDITGTLVSDGLTVDGTGDLGTIGNGAFNAAAALGFQSDRAFFGYSASQGALIQSGSGKAVFIEVNSDTLDGGTRAAQFASNGDVSFYEDTGTTAKFFWDASSERLGLGTSSPANDLHVSSATGSAKLTSSAGGANLFMESAADNVTRVRWSSNSLFAIRNDTTSSDVIYIDQDGRLGVGAIPNNNVLLHVQGELGTTNGTESDPTHTFYGDPDTGMFRAAENTLAMSTAGTERMRIDASGHAIIPAGVTLGTAVGTYNAANTLDDYEEGTWTPTLNSASFTATGITVTTANCRYVKVGNLVQVSFKFSFTGTSGNFTEGDAASLGGLPFTLGSTGNGGGTANASNAYQSGTRTTWQTLAIASSDDLFLGLHYTGGTNGRSTGLSGVAVYEI